MKKTLFTISALFFWAAIANGASADYNRLVVNADQGKLAINRNIYGHFAEHLGRCFYDGIWVGEDSEIPNTRGIRSDIVEALKKIKIPVLRWPGGCFADEYHWKDGIGPRENRPSMVNTHWGQVTENNHFGTHEFLDLCEQLGCEPYICGNVGSGTVLEMQQWVEYITFAGTSPMADLRRANGRDEPWRLKYFGIGNENWGCGGNMSPQYYADLCRRFGTYVRNFGDNHIYKIACGGVGSNYNWTEVLMRESSRPRDGGSRLRMHGLSYHYYCGTGKESRSATQFKEIDWIHQLKAALRMEELLTRHETIMDMYDPEKNIHLIVDEWGAWHNVEPGTNKRFLYQQNSLRDALVAAITLNIFNQHCERVKMANIAQTVNVLQAMILTEGARMLTTPSYHVFEMFTVHHDATLLPSELTCRDYTFGDYSIPALHASASKDSSDKIHVSVCNLDANEDIELACEIHGFKPKAVSGRVLTADTVTAHNTFDNKRTVEPKAFEAFKLKANTISMTMPSKSVVVLEIRK
jgi:alpha-N-arabinofuranosidase